MRRWHPKKSMPSPRSVSSTTRVFAGCRVSPIWARISPSRRCASRAWPAVRHRTTKSSAYRTSVPSCACSRSQVSSSSERTMLASRGEITPPCGVPATALPHLALLHHPRLQPLTDQPQHPTVADPPSKAFHQVLLIDRVEEALDVAIDDVALAATAQQADRL